MADSETRDYKTLNAWRQLIPKQIEDGSIDQMALFLKSAGRPPQKALTAEFNAWLDDETYWNGVDRPKLDDSYVGKSLRNALEFGRDISFMSWSGAYLSWILQSAKDEHSELNKLLKKAQTDPQNFNYRSFIVDSLEMLGQAVRDGDPKQGDPIQSKYYNAEDPEKVQYKARFADGSWHNVDSKEVVELLRKQGGPHVMFTANHAFLDSEAADITTMGDAFNTIYSESLSDASKAENSDAAKISGWNEAGLDSQKTVMVMATNTCENRFLNLAQLFRRINEIESNHAHPEKDKFEHVSPIAMQTVATILAASVKEGEQNNIRIARDGNDKRQFSDVPVHIRPEALDTMRRMLVTVFSKGGNDSRDAMRLLVHAMHAKGADGKPLVVMPEGLSIPDFIGNISMMVTGLNELPMDAYYKENGVRMNFLTNKNDIIAPIPRWLHAEDEPVYNFVGESKRAGGHMPEIAANGILGDWRLRDQQCMAFAATRGKAAITDIKLVPAEDGTSFHPNSLRLEVAPGTTDALMAQANDTLNQALRDAGLADVTLKRDDDGHGRRRYYLINNDSKISLITPDSIAKLKAAFKGFSAEPNTKNPHETAPPTDAPLWVSESVVFEKLNGIKGGLVIDAHNGKKPDRHLGEPMNIDDPGYHHAGIEVGNRSGKGVIRHPRIDRTPHDRIAIPTGDARQRS